MVYDNRHRSFLQAVIKNGVIDEQRASALCVKIFDERVTVFQVAALINDKLSPLEMSLKAGLCEITGEKFWAVVGTTHEEAFMIPSMFGNSQRAFLRLIYSELINSDDGCISSTDCLNLVHNADFKLSIGDANIFIKNLIENKWLQAKNGQYYMGIRSVIEMMPYFRATYQENFHNCYLCKEIMFHGFKCQNCPNIFHNYCISRYTNMQKKNKCPHCKNDVDVSGLPIIPDVSQAPNVQRQIEDEPMDVDAPEPKKSKKSRTHKN